jgi:hypothetical protein
VFETKNCVVVSCFVWLVAVKELSVCREFIVVRDVWN